MDISASGISPANPPPSINQQKTTSYEEINTRIGEIVNNCVNSIKQDQEMPGFIKKTLLNNLQNKTLKLISDSKEKTINKQSIYRLFNSVQNRLSAEMTSFSKQAKMNRSEIQSIAKAKQALEIALKELEPIFKEVAGVEASKTMFQKSLQGIEINTKPVGYQVANKVFLPKDYKKDELPEGMIVIPAELAKDIQRCKYTLTIGPEKRVLINFSKADEETNPGILEQNQQTILHALKEYKKHLTPNQFENFGRLANQGIAIDLTKKIIELELEDGKLIKDFATPTNINPAEFDLKIDGDKMIFITTVDFGIKEIETEKILGYITAKSVVTIPSQEFDVLWDSHTETKDVAPHMRVVDYISDLEKDPKIARQAVNRGQYLENITLNVVVEEGEIEIPERDRRRGLSQTKTMDSTTPTPEISPKSISSNKQEAPTMEDLTKMLQDDAKKMIEIHKQSLQNLINKYQSVINTLDENKKIRFEKALGGIIQKMDSLKGTNINEYDLEKILNEASALYIKYLPIRSEEINIFMLEEYNHLLDLLHGG